MINLKAVSVFMQVNIFYSAWTHQNIYLVKKEQHLLKCEYLLVLLNYISLWIVHQSILTDGQTKLAGNLWFVIICFIFFGLNDYAD